jgi:NAD+ synthase (glutamine-hydrolysing)
MKIGLLQLNYTVGDLKGNAEKILSAVRLAAASGAELCITSELALTGYPPRDLLLDSWFVRNAEATLKAMAVTLAGGPALLVGAPEEAPGPLTRPCYNSAFLLKDGAIAASFRKKLLPNYDVFDEARYFEPAKEVNILDHGNLRIGVTICEDIWNDGGWWTEYHYHEDPVATLANDGVDLIVNLSASPFSLGKQLIRERMIGTIAAGHRIPFVYTNQAGGNDDLVFDGRSLFFDAEGVLQARGMPFSEDILLIDLQEKKGRISPDDLAPEPEAWAALVTGTRDYVRKSGFTKVLIGLSGGIDSSLTAAIAADALGAENVLGVLMPSPFTTRTSIDDAQELGRILSLATMTIPIEPIMNAFEQALTPAFRGYPQDVTEENLQARIRGNLLMALSNKYGSMLITTGNKSELAVGYCTIYGDMSGGLAAISDVPKTLVYGLCRWLNLTRGQIIPESVLEKPPSAELRHGQTDQDTLPPYDMLDRILVRLIERHASIEELVDEGFDRDIVRRVEKLVRGAEFKRKQAPPGIKITDRAFGTGWRMPIAARIRFAGDHV